MSISRSQYREPHWIALSRLPSLKRPDAQLLPWLKDTGSLTAKLMHLSDKHFQVKVLQQLYSRPHPNEAKALALAPYELALIREVILLGRDTPWIFARSVLPFKSMTGKLRHLRKHGDRPLGAFLFSQHNLKRSPIAVSLIGLRERYVPVTLMNNASVWGRRSIFSLNNKAMLVSEVFLPGFLKFITKVNHDE